MKPKYLAAPVLPQMSDDNVITENELEDNKIDVLVNRYVNAMTGDSVYLYFGDLEPYYFGVKDVTENFPIAHGFDAKLIPDGVYKVYYNSIDSFNNLSKSEVATAIVQRKPLASLPPPVYPDAINNWLTMAQLTGGVKVSITDLSTISNNSVVTLYWEGYHFDNINIPSTNGSMPLIVSAADITAGHIDFYIDSSIALAISLGYITCWYTVHIDGIADRTSPTSFVNIDTFHKSDLPAPTFPQATESGLSIQVVVDANGGLVRAYYGTLHQGDIVTFTLHGYDATGFSVVDANYSSVVIVNDQNIINGYVQMIFPASIATAIGDKGKLFAQYNVTYVDNGGFSSSAESSVKLIADSATNGLGLYVTTGAPAYVPEDVNLNPRNKAVIFGKPGTIVTASCTAPAVFMANKLHSITFTLSVSGKYSLDVQSTKSGDINIEINDNANPPHHENAVMTFAPYSSGQGDFKAYAASTYAVSDGITPCSLYIITKDNPAITKVHISLNGSATLVNGENIGTYPLTADKAVEIDILDTVNETVRAILTLPEASGSIQSIPVNFVKPAY